uniref:Uncharacterized protein n=1 Tax=Helianthus annuus TaxID=4232 RepID=A0A251TF75_HELAN
MACCLAGVLLSDLKGFFSSSLLNYNSLSYKIQDSVWQITWLWVKRERNWLENIQRKKRIRVTGHLYRRQPDFDQSEKSRTLFEIFC